MKCEWCEGEGLRFYQMTINPYDKGSMVHQFTVPCSKCNGTGEYTTLWQRVKAWWRK